MKASELMRGVVADARSLDREEYRPVSSYWHKPINNPPTCLVCFAGVWLTRHFGPGQEIIPAQMDTVQENTTVVLDKIREADFDGIGDYANLAGIDKPWALEAALTALENLNQLPMDLILWRVFSNWDDFDEFLKGVEALAKLLDEKGL